MELNELLRQAEQEAELNRVCKLGFHFGFFVGCILGSLLMFLLLRLGG